jgi:uncharacterized protein (TIGR00255 family)
MTGFGRADCEFDGDVVSVELSSVNHRFLDCGVRLPPAWSALEPMVKETIRKQLTRGKVNVTINRKRGPGSQRQTVACDPEVAKQYIAASKDLVQMLGSMESLSLDVLAQLDGVFYQEEAEEDLEKIQAVVVRVLSDALERLNAMRTTEGEALAEELRYRLSLTREALAVIEQRLPDLNALYEQRLRARINELKADVTLAEDRIAMEIAFMADKGDVTEEVVRLKTHFDHAEDLLGRDEPVGRELTFLAQELQREINTLGAKIHDGDVIKAVLRMKSELERIREQVQNIE